MIKHENQQYEVTIERNKKDSWMDAKYHWEVKVYVDKTEDDGIGGSRTTRGERIFELRGGGYTYGLNAAKKKAIKHILSVEKDFSKGRVYGVVFNIEKDTADNVVAKLKQ